MQVILSVLVSGELVNGQTSKDARERARLTERVVVFSMERRNRRDKRC